MEDLGFEAVVVLDYKVPPGMTHHHSLMLLHECKYAIFDFSHQSGQLMEIERVRDYGVQALIVFQTADPSFFPVSEMVKALVAEEGIKVEPYQDFDELRSKIDAFLAGNKPS